MHLSFNLNQVFENSKNIPVSYVSREIDFKLESSLRGKTHVILFGSSGQGKTTLRKKWIDDFGRDAIKIHCFQDTTFSELNKSILKSAGYKFELKESTSASNSSKNTFDISIDTQIKIGLQKEYDSFTGHTKEFRSFEIDLNNINDIVYALNAIDFKKIIILEEFHRLDYKVQKKVAEALKVHFDETEIKFVIIGVWLDENKIINMNGDLSSRTVTINADEWKEEYLKEVIENGTKKLNIEFDEEIIDKIIEDSIYNISILKEICFEICKEKKVSKTVESPKRFLIDSKNLEFDLIIRRVINNHNGRYQSLLNKLMCQPNITHSFLFSNLIKMMSDTQSFNFSEGVNSSKIYAFIKNEMILNSLSFRELNDILKLINSVQDELSIIPNVIFFNELTNILYLTDKRFLLWLLYQDEDDLTLQLELK